MIVRVGLLDKSENYIARLANYQSVHASEIVQFEIYLFTNEQMLRQQMEYGKRMDVLVADEELLQSPEEYARNVELAFWSEDKHEQMRDGYPVICRFQKAGDIFLAIQGLASKHGKGTSRYALQENGRVCLFLGGAGGAGSSTVAMGCAAALAAQGRNTIYFSLKQKEENDYFRVSGSSLTDVMYEIGMWRQLGGTDQGQLQMKLQSMLRKDDETGVYSFAPFDLPVSAMNFGSDDMKVLLQAVSGLCERCVVCTDNYLSATLLQAIRLADWLVVVSDSTTAGNEKTNKLLSSLEVIDSMDEKLIEGSVGVIYNKFGSAGHKAELPKYACELGTIPRYQNAEKSRIVRELRTSSVYSQLNS